MKPLFIVSGLPRSGTSMMMKMLEAGGISIFQDGIRQADIDNPKGYYEYEKVKDLKTDASWLPNAQEKAIKIISSLLTCVPDSIPCKILFMRREIAEVLASQKKMLQHNKLPDNDVPDQVLAAKFSMHLRKIKKFLEEHENMSTLYINYDEVIAQPVRKTEEIASFLNIPLDTAAMAAVVDKSLYRQKV